jgi:hypothetical protein
MRTLYQAIQNTENPDKIEHDGPIFCGNASAWLGPGYYFWDSFIELAHIWGRVHCGGDYMICEAFSEFNTEEILDLINNPDQIRDFWESFLLLKDNPRLLCPGGSLTVGSVIESLKKTNAFPYKAIRANGNNSFNSYQNPVIKVLFAYNLPAFMELPPAWQVCVIDKTFLQNGSYHVIFPEEYAGPLPLAL